MKMRSSIAVLLSSFNGEKYIRQQIDSILKQDLDDTDLHLYIRDDGSKDATVKIVEEYLEKHDNITLFAEENIGYIASFLKLIEYMKSYEIQYAYYSLSDQDDVWDTDKLQSAIDMIETEDDSKPILYQATTRVVDENLNFKRVDQICTKKITFYNTAVQTFSAGHTYVFNHNLLMCIPDNVDPKQLYGHDALLTNAASIMGKVLFDNEPHNSYRQHGNNQIGTAQNGLVGWIKIRINKIKRGDGIVYSRQIKYIAQLFNEHLSADERKEIERFFSAQKSFISRLRFVITTKLYRQGGLETLAFKGLYVFGGYNLNSHGENY